MVFIILRASADNIHIIIRLMLIILFYVMKYKIIFTLRFHFADNYGNCSRSHHTITNPFNNFRYFLCDCCTNHQGSTYRYTGSSIIYYPLSPCRTARCVFSGVTFLFFLIPSNTSSFFSEI